MKSHDFVMIEFFLYIKVPIVDFNILVGSIFIVHWVMFLNYPIDL